MIDTIERNTLYALRLRDRMVDRRRNSPNLNIAHFS